MRPSLRQMEYIVTVHRLGQFSLAARLLNVSQPSLSAQVAEVEETFGVKLFDRGRAGSRTTARGEEFVAHAQRILAGVEGLRAAMSASGRLRLGVLPSIGPYLLPQVVARIHRAEPDLRLIVREENTQSLEDGLKTGRFDAILSTPEDHPNTSQARLFTEALWVAVAADSPLARAGVLTAADLAGQRFLTLDRGHRLSRIVYALAAASGGVVSDDYEGTSLDSILLMAATGAGVAVIPELFARRQAVYREEVAVRPLDMAEAHRDIALLTPIGTGPLAALELALREVTLGFGLRGIGA